MNDKEKLQEFKQLVKDLRRFQKDYFKTRSYQLLDICRKQERLVDKWIEKYEDTQTTMEL